MENDPKIKAKELIEILRYFKSVKSITLQEGERCPLAIEDKNLTHYELSEAVAGLGLIRWNCPFCKKHFEE